MAETVTSITRPAPFIEAAGQTFLEGLQTAIGDAKTEDLTKLFGPQFVAGPGAFTQQAQSLAGGLGSFAPFLQTAAHKLDKQVTGTSSIINNLCLRFNKTLLMQR